MRRIKWFTPADDRAFAPFGIDCEGAATLYSNHGGCHLAGADGLGRPPATELAEANHAFWVALDRAPAPARPPLRQRLRGLGRPRSAR
ncbi:hypothetical protein B0E53_00405 [Micromonospora sp. MH33]|uniref:hypothetical protein n=1 Tax=Micromonospora sp. MH33 TaxID=1945509 RepID=UPI000D14B2D8|nr:hypothetical protein [Micromonospora sp. MH33]PSK67595.1 hypothetical protein B0E53_00405 [Micromonospora sp. MH33]